MMQNQIEHARSGTGKQFHLILQVLVVAALVASEQHITANVPFPAHVPTAHTNVCTATRAVVGLV
jgi:hypothetical protein